MSFGGGGGGSSTISGATDVVLSNPASNQFFGYNGATSKWNNIPLVGTVALANGGGQESVVTNAGAIGAVTLNLASGNVFSITLTGNTTLTFSGATAGMACSFSLYVKQGGTARTLAFPAAVAWAGGTVASVTATAGATDVFVFESIDGGTTWYGSLVGANFF